MAPMTAPLTPGFASFQRFLSTEPLDSSTTYLVSLLKRRQLKGSKRCAAATTLLLLRTVELTKQPDCDRLLQRVSEVGKKLIAAAPHEPAVGNIVRRVLGSIRDEDEDEAAGKEGDGDWTPERDDSPICATPLERASSPRTPFGAPNGPFGRSMASVSPSPQRGPARPPLMSSHTGAPAPARPPMTSMFSIIAHPTMRMSGQDSPGQGSGSGTVTPRMSMSGTLSNLRAEVIKGIKEILDEINEADDEISAAALEQVHPQETIVTYSSSLTVQRFLLKAASKRKFTVIHAESYPNNHQKTHALLTGSTQEEAEDDDILPNESFSKPLTSAGVNVIMVPDSAIFAVMSRATKVVLDAHAVLTNGSLVAAAGSKAVIKAARFHRVPVVVLAATYKLSPTYPYDPYTLIEYGDASKVVPVQEGALREGLKDGVRNPLYDFVEAGDVDLFVTNQVPAVVSTGYLYRVVREQYHDEDLEL
ncbi:translation initiation factor eIF-2B beta subunit [Exophiala viscosa]|uniref:Translation initiation factor eIF2B subunit beta n=1 Tax=Exophiala viscosa TaxID=2486360 RepID=A0AAN6DZ50_9EURO|nr:translation initiation factor eIF-2B beta subunit [Exophiala viscosa]KAI1622368.1 translation initiation factor eIF-2B beta subunit [Exophiala viscosa]